MQRLTRTALAAATLAGLATIVSAQTLRFASQGDPQTMDPHSQNESFTNSVNQQVYEYLVHRDKQLNFVPGLATSWEQVSPLKWRFKLRQGVKFHDGSAFNADDVVFSINRAKEPTSQIAVYANAVGTPKKIDDYTVAARWYRDYLASFPDDPESAATNYLLGETLFDREGRQISFEHGNRRVVRIEKNGLTTVLADKFGGIDWHSSKLGSPVIEGTLAKAYGVPVDVLAERLWLDLELEKNDPPETEGMIGAAELARIAEEAAPSMMSWRMASLTICFGRSKDRK